MNSDPYPATHPEIVNRQRKIELDLLRFEAFSLELLAHVEEAGGFPFVVAFVSDRRMTELNTAYRGKKSTTDVLSFPAVDEAFEEAESLGDIVISAEQAARQAKSNRLSLEREIKQLMLHGLLHLCGHDHETDNGEMNSRELELREELGI
jgi:probable rRNA maturation factor